MVGDGVGKGGEETTDEKGRDALPEGGVGESSPQDTGGVVRPPPNLAGDRGGGDKPLGWLLAGEGIALGTGGSPSNSRITLLTPPLFRAKQ